MIPPADVKELSVVDYFQMVLRRIWIVISIVGVVMGVVAYKSFSTPKLYRAKATVLIERRIPLVTGTEQKVYRYGAPDKETQELLLRSYSLAERVVERLDFINDPDFRHSNDPARVLYSMVRITPVEESKIVSIEVTGRDPLKIANIANVWAEESVKEDISRRTNVAKEGVAWLEKQTDETLTQLQKAERELNDFVKKHRIVNIPEVGERTEQTIQDLKVQKVRLEKEIIEMLKVYKEKHPKIFALKNELAAVEKKMNDETDAMYETQELALQYKLLQRAADDYKRRYENFRTKIQDLDISRELRSSNISLVDKAQPPSAPFRPQPARDLTRAFLIALVFSIGLCYFLEYVDSTLKTSEDIELYTKMPFLGYVPMAGKELSVKANLDLVTSKQQFSQTAEAFRSIRVSLLFVSPEDKPLKSVVVTSSVPQEGKTFVAANIAIACATAKEPTLLVDADMRKGRLASAFDLENANGLTTILAGMCSWEEAIVRTSVPNLFLVPRGTIAPNPAQLLSSDKLLATLRNFEGKFKRVILDAPPALSVADALILGDKSDGLIFVVRAEATPLNHIIEAKKRIQKKVKIIGAILNGVDVKKDRYYYYHYSYYGHDSKQKT